MLQAWLAKNAVKLGIIGVVITTFFLFGYYVNGKFNAAKIQKLKVDLKVSKLNYDIAVEQNEICNNNQNSLKDAIESQNQSIIEQASESRRRLLEQKRMYESALARERVSRATELSKIESEKQDLLRRMATMSASEACHESFLELVK